jgi:hypothetical protein
MFNRLKLYTVHVKASGSDALENPVFVREGFNLYAFFFTILWALYHRCYYFAALILAVNIAIVLAVEAHMISDTAATVTQVAVQFLVGAHANDMLRDKLRGKGYVVQDIAAAESLLRAQQRYFDRITLQAA